MFYVAVVVVPSTIRLFVWRLCTAVFSADRFVPWIRLSESPYIPMSHERSPWVAHSEAGSVTRSGLLPRHRWIE